MIFSGNVVFLRQGLSHSTALPVVWDSLSTVKVSRFVTFHSIARCMGQSVYCKSVRLIYCKLQLKKLVECGDSTFGRTHVCMMLRI